MSATTIPPLPKGDYTFRFEDASLAPQPTSLPPETPPPPPQTTSWDLLQKVVTYPFEKAKKWLYAIPATETLDVRGGEANRASDASAGWQRLPFTPIFGKALLKHYRGDPEHGLFNVASSVLPFLMTQLFPSESPTLDDLLLCCDSKFVNQYRRPILHFIGGAKIKVKEYQLALENCCQKILDEYMKSSDSDSIDAADLSQVYSTAMVAKLLFGHPGTIDTFREIAQAASLLINGPQEKGPWAPGKSIDLDGINPSDPDFNEKMAQRKKESQEKYDKEVGEYERLIAQKERERSKAVETLRNAIDMSFNSKSTHPFGSLVEKLRSEHKLTELQIKALILTLFVAGSETSSTLQSGLLWQLGRDPKYQEEICQELAKSKGSLLEKARESETITQLFNESLRLYTPINIITRTAAKDLVCIGTDKQDNEVYRKEMPKGADIQYYPSDAGKFLFEEDSASFDPKQHGPSNSTLSWLPFGDGKHACPGRWLARAEVSALVASLVQNYKITSLTEEKPTLKARSITRRVEEEIPIKLEKR